MRRRRKTRIETGTGIESDHLLEVLQLLKGLLGMDQWQSPLMVLVLPMKVLTMTAGVPVAISGTGKILVIVLNLGSVEAACLTSQSWLQELERAVAMYVLGFSLQV